MEPSKTPLLRNSSTHALDDLSSPHPQTSLSDLFIFQDDTIGSSVTPMLDAFPIPDMEPLLLPRSQYNLPTPQPAQPTPQLTSHPPAPPQLPTTSTHVPPKTAHFPQPTRIAPRTPLLATGSPFIPPNTPRLPPATPILPRTPVLPTPHASPMSIATPLTIYPTTPQTTPVSHPPLTPVTPRSEHLAVFSAAIGPLPDNRVESQFSAATNRAWAIAHEKKILLRERLKRTPGQTGSISKRSSQREAKVSRTREKEYRSALEQELKSQIHTNCVLWEYMDRFFPGELENARRRAV